MLEAGRTYSRGGGGGIIAPTQKKKKLVYIYIYVEILNFGPNSPPIK